MNIGRGLPSGMAFSLAMALFFSTIPAFPQIASESKTTVWQIQDAVVVPPVAGGSLQLSWYDNADNETGFIVERQDTINAPGIWTEVARFGTPNNGGFGGVGYNDAPGSGSFLYRVAAYNDAGMSTYDTLPAAVIVP